MALKMLFLGALILLLLIPLAMIRGLVEEREQSRAYAEEETIRMWGGEQTLAGPVLVVPYLNRRVDAEGRIEETEELACFLPAELRIEGRVQPESRRRGIYEVTLYTTMLSITGTFPAPSFAGWRIPERDILWRKAVLAVEISGMRGVGRRVRLLWDRQPVDFSAGKAQMGVFGGQIQAPVQAAGGEHAFALELALRGGRSLSFLPLGEETRVSLDSSWESPSFSGSFLPAERSVGPEGFRARWTVLSLGRSYPQSWRSGDIRPETLKASSFGVELALPVDSYVKSLRSVKYGVLFVLLPFLTFFLFELFGRRRIHPMQYLLVGFAVCLFYLLLLSVSEHLGFEPAYLLAALATTALVAAYSGAVLSGWRRGAVLAALMGGAYLFLYVALRSEDYALLIGSLGLFLILAAVMLLTRRIDWYRLGRPRPEGPGEGGPGASEAAGGGPPPTQPGGPTPPDPPPGPPPAAGPAEPSSASRSGLGGESPLADARLEEVLQMLD